MFIDMVRDTNYFISEKAEAEGSESIWQIVPYMPENFFPGQQPDKDCINERLVGVGVYIIYAFGIDPPGNLTGCRYDR
ncbi:hypothetical protein GCM10011511_55090 [Puia dinghuensis]|uniref:Uncharacterized protein n=1 Tax=Puia dinghuensis TaxID=1792502 RepID=A0A8J2UIS3_9BACT|nr:hypothetical protein GCM10011511_55090 [Puia dinghuensis]